MAGRNDAALAAALQAMAQAVQGQQNVGDNAGFRSLTTFQRENPPTFKGKYDRSAPDFGTIGFRIKNEVERGLEDLHAMTS